jgi:hypothetical protein
MQRITFTIVPSILAVVCGTVLFTSAIQNDRSPILPELKQDGTQNPPPQHSPLPPELKEPGTSGDPPNSPHIPIPPELKTPALTPPNGMVAINGMKLLAAGGVEVVYEVPNDQWLVLTDLEAEWLPSGAPVLAQRTGALMTDVRSAFLGTAFHSFTGVAFQPGSQVVLRESSLASSVKIAFSFSGYLVHQ